MLKRSLSFLVILSFASAHASAGFSLFGSIPCMNHGCGENCSAESCGDDPSCFAPNNCVGDKCGDLSCGDGCGESCGEGCESLFGNSCGSCLAGLTSLLHKSDHCFDDFISPMTNPVNFEDPRTLTEARLIFVNHRVPAAVGGGTVQLYAMQLRAALNEDVSIIATKDGFFVSDNPIVSDGWANLAAGLKVNVFKDVAAQQIASVGTTFEIPLGSQSAYQGRGDGVFHMFATGGTQILDHYHLISATGFRLPVDQNAESTMMYWSNHLDRKLGNSGFYLLGECNWYHWTVNGDSFPASVEGLDVINFGSRNVDGNSIVTGAIGVKYKPSGNTEIGVAWEAPLTDRQDILEHRLTVDWIIRY